MEGLNGKIRYEFSAEAWQHSPPGGWCFVSVPETLAREIRGNLQWQEEGWGRLKATAKLGNSEWQTAIWFDRKRNTYLLPLKAEIRRKELVAIGKRYDLTIWV